MRSLLPLYVQIKHATSEICHLSVLEGVCMRLHMDLHMTFTLRES